MKESRETLPSEPWTSSDTRIGVMPHPANKAIRRLETVAECLGTSNEWLTKRPLYVPPGCVQSARRLPTGSIQPALTPRKRGLECVRRGAERSTEPKAPNSSRLREMCGVPSCRAYPVSPPLTGFEWSRPTHFAASINRSNAAQIPTG